MRVPTKKAWLGPGEPRCTLCDGRPREYFVDGQLSHNRGWALFCSVCWKMFGCRKLGTGFGQKYNARWPYLKLEG